MGERCANGRPRGDEVIRTQRKVVAARAGGLAAGSTAALLLWLVVIPGSTDAYTISTLISPGCHEDMTAQALRTVRLDVPAAGPLPVTRNDQALVDDVQFTLAPDMRDLGGVALMVSVRDNDLKGRSSNDLTELAEVHGNPDNQDEHCLRSRTQDEPGGSQAAVDDCRTFIRGRVAEALEGLDANGFPDPGKRADLAVHLALRGNIDVSLPIYYLRIGQAIHGVEDSFSHTYRTADGMRITAVTNWIDVADATYDESRDGPAHAAKMDACNDPDELLTTRHRLATEASVALLRATLDPLKTKAEKMTTVDGILDTYLSYSPGCTFDNGWCNAPERQYKDPGATFLGCSQGGEGLPGTIGALLALTALSRRRRKALSIAALLVIAGVAAFAPAGASAADTPPTAATQERAAADKEAAPPPTTVPVPQPGPSDPSEMAWGGYLGLSGSVDKPAAAIQLGVRLRLSKNWTIGWDVESNPWVSVNGPTFMRAGTLNTFGTVILRFPLAYENFNLRTTVNLGISYLLIDLYGAPKGSLGLYGAIYPLGLEWKLSRTFFLIINPLGIAVPVPQLKGVPLSYPQYRFSIGLGVLGG
jgi:uncharacterized protein (TIGR03382 family)